MAASAHKPRNAVESLRDIVQDLLEPELRALKVEVEALRNESRGSIEALRNEMRLRDDKQAQAIQNLSDKLGYMNGCPRAVGCLEDRVPRAST